MSADVLGRARGRLPRARVSAVSFAVNESAVRFTSTIGIPGSWVPTDAEADAASDAPTSSPLSSIEVTALRGLEERRFERATLPPDLSDWPCQVRDMKTGTGLGIWRFVKQKRPMEGRFP